jgi:hypothetical protein
MTHRLTGFVLVSLLSSLGCHRDRRESIARSPEKPDAVFVAEPATADSVEDDPLERAREAAAALARRDLKALASMIHPTKGVRLSPYAYVDPSSDVVLSARQVEDGFSDGTVRTWGTADGSGDPIRGSFSAYFDRFVYDADFASAKEVSLDRVLGSGNTINNTQKVYATASVVELHIPGQDPQFEGMDWRSLRLVFEREGERLWLVGVIHDEWTI